MTNDKMVAEHYSTKVSIMLRDVKGDILNRYPFSVFSQEELRQQRKKQLYDIGDRVMTFFNDEGSVKHGFEQREGQQDMAFEILDAILNEQHIAVEAGVGIGKSFAYLVPLLLYNQRTGKPVIVATSTIALQEQLLADVKRLQQLLKVYPEVILAKGQTHYICAQRANEYFADIQAEMRTEIRKAIQDGCQERKIFPFDVPTEIWNKINIQAYGKNCSKCHSNCDYRSMRSSLKCTSGVILCNQDFLTSHLMSSRFGNDGLMTSAAEIVVIDEAHNLEDKVRSATTVRFSKGSLCRKVKVAVNAVHPSERHYVEKSVDNAVKAVQAFFQCLEHQVKEQIRTAEQDMKYVERFFFQADDSSLALLGAMADEISNASEDIEIHATFGNEFRSDIASDELMALSMELSDLSECFKSKLLWIEKHGKETELVTCPKNTRNNIYSRFFDGSIRTILTSATLTCSNSPVLEEQYSYFIRNTGFPYQNKGVLSEPKPSPYPYDEHAMIYYCSDLPHPTKEREAFIQAGTDRLIDILEISGGKALVLFTAKADMEEVYQILEQKELPFKILMQQQGSSQDKVLKEFRENVNSVLLGTGAYWEGISIEGKSLSNLVIFRLPFPVPDPIINYKSSIAEDPLMEVQVPEMITKLKQGLGRLIRNYTDTGIVSIIDPRLNDERPARYRDITWDSLPIQNRTSNIKKLAAFYSQLQEKA